MHVGQKILSIVRDCLQIAVVAAVPDDSPAANGRFVLIAAAIFSTESVTFSERFPTTVPSNQPIEAGRGAFIEGRYLSIGSSSVYRLHGVIVRKLVLGRGKI